MDAMGSVLAGAVMCGEPQRRGCWQPAEVTTGPHGQPRNVSSPTSNKGKGLLRGNSLSGVCTWS